MLHNLHNCPSQIRNDDDSVFSLCPKSGRMLAFQGVRYIHHVSSSSWLNNYNGVLQVLLDQLLHQSCLFLQDKVLIQ